MHKFPLFHFLPTQCWAALPVRVKPIEICAVTLFPSIIAMYNSKGCIIMGKCAVTCYRMVFAYSAVLINHLIMGYKFPDGSSARENQLNQKMSKNQDVSPVVQSNICMCDARVYGLERWTGLLD